MGVTTTADKHKENAYNSLQCAITEVTYTIKEMESMTDPTVWGGQDWRTDFIEETEKSIKRLNKMKRKLVLIQRKLY